MKIHPFGWLLYEYGWWRLDIYSLRMQVDNTISLLRIMQPAMNSNRHYFIRLKIAKNKQESSVFSDIDPT